jgi:hypothetical protein
MRAFAKGAGLSSLLSALHLLLPDVSQEQPAFPVLAHR